MAEVNIYQYEQLSSRFCANHKVKQDDNREIYKSIHSMYNVHPYLRIMEVLGMHSAGFTATVLFAKH